MIKYSEQTVLIWVNLYYNGLSYNKISKIVDVNKEIVFEEVNNFIKKYPKPDWAETQIFRASGLLENICKKHEVGHPHENWLKIYDPDGKKGLGIHGCCSCCCKK